MMLIKDPIQHTAKILQHDFSCNEPLKATSKNAKSPCGTYKKALCGSSVLVKLGHRSFKCEQCGAKYTGDLDC